ncbi:Bug family tripartite tricarboxylate transporter substrate binding protein [Plastoroseomonas hellenica]|uniref:Bug family tripartite tricarboxylate transporter substrate binding protein n=1 Tax=Plastoroseomonas hellenica TaxID=2687306 RepID=UPI001BA6CB70|nr:tripartite tricarboxylate transporter substrate binding protein [Plastoroseomonas hellenica]MBR0644741.1 tripartite tricarboxylate transporter substrate binding protein [Plastoroseomonas hellenica]
MPVTPRMRRRAVLASLPALPLARIAAAQSEPLRIIVNFPPGSLGDGLARLLADRAQRDGIGAAVVENRPGAAGNIGAAALARAQPDGRALLISIDTIFTVNPHLYRNLGFDPGSLEPVGMAGHFGLALLVHPSSPARDLAGLIAAARRESVFYCSGGNGSPGHLAMERLRHEAGLPPGAFSHVPMRGNTEALTSLLAGTVQAGFLAIGGGPELVRAGRLVAIAVSTPERIPFLPEVPTMIEAGAPGFDLRIGLLLMAPRGTPLPALAPWLAALRAVLTDPAAQPRFTAWGLQPDFADRAATASWIAAAHDRWGRMVRETGMQLD